MGLPWKKGNEAKGFQGEKPRQFVESSYYDLKGNRRLESTNIGTLGARCNSADRLPADFTFGKHYKSVATM